MGGLLNKGNEATDLVDTLKEISVNGFTIQFYPKKDSIVFEIFTFENDALFREVGTIYDDDYENINDAKLIGAIRKSVARIKFSIVEKFPELF